MSAPYLSARGFAADEALRAFIARTGCDCEDSLAHLLADLMHWSDKCRLDFDEALYLAHCHYRATDPKGGAA